ncbi:MAG TPA: ABC transporter substrate-binding protein [Firmicutes bacterium]|nr:ABC transporter substrate-binding protein [Bacillota bacterium]
MKKLMMMIAMLCLGVVAGCSSNGMTVEDLEEKGTLVVGLSADYPPFEFHKMIDGVDTIVGFDVMLAEEIAKELDVNLEISEMKFDGLIGALQAGHVDMVISGMTPDETRAKAVDFSDLYYNGLQGVLVSDANVSVLKSGDDLKDKAIGAQMGSVQSALAKELSTNVKELAKTQDLVLELSNGNLDAVIVGSEIAKRYADEFDGVSLSDIDLPTDEGMAVTMMKNSPELVEKVNEIIKSLKESGKLDEMLEEAINLMNE